MLFGTPQRIQNVQPIPVECNETPIKRAVTYKYLGLLLDENLSFSAHVDYIIRKTIGKMKQPGRICHILDRNMSLYLYQSLIVPMFDYMDFVWDTLSKKDTQPL